MEHGGSDVSRLLHWLLRRAGSRLPEMELRKPHCILQLQEIKEAFCHLDQVIVRFVTLSISRTKSTT